MFCSSNKLRSSHDHINEQKPLKLGGTLAAYCKELITGQRSRVIWALEQLMLQRLCQAVHLLDPVQVFVVRGVAHPELEDFAVFIEAFPLLIYQGISDTVVWRN